LGAQKLNELLSQANEENFKEYISTNTVGDFVAQYGGFGFPDFGLFVSACPHIVPRFYSVVAQSGAGKRTAEILVATNKFGTGNRRQGLSTSFLQTRPEAVALRIAKGSFTYPRNKSTAFVAIGIGNGISMILSLLEYRANLQGRIGPMVLILEGSTPSEMAILDGQIQHFIEQKLAKCVTWAYANDPDAKYRGFEAAMKGAQAAVWDLWMDSDTYLFAAGCLRSDIDTIRELLCKITVDEAGLRDEEPMAVSNQHEFHFELNGMTTGLGRGTVGTAVNMFVCVNPSWGRVISSHG
jgi:hypothetical protein